MMRPLSLLLRGSSDEGLFEELFPNARDMPGMRVALKNVFGHGVNHGVNRGVKRGANRSLGVYEWQCIPKAIWNGRQRSV